MKNLISDNYLQYIDFLKELAMMPSTFGNPNDVMKAIEFCKKIFEMNLSDYIIYFDAEHNLIALPKNVNVDEDIVYLSAHVDTVDADPKDWDKPFHPWKVYENDKEIVARGVSDCKAGVAYQLFLSFLVKKKLIKIKNLVFTITFKEEGAGKKTSIEIAKQIGKKLPLSNQSTYFIVLENNVSVKTPPVLSIYTAERGNFAIKITGFIPELQRCLMALSHWNPVSIEPLVDMETEWQVQKQEGGHVCSVSRENNLLTKIILGADKNSLVKAGSKGNFSVVPTEIFTSQYHNREKHSLVLSNRSFDSRDEVLGQLNGIEYEALKDFAISGGFNVEEKFKQNKISKILEDCKDESALKLEYSCNIGGSDATAIYSSMDVKNRERFLPIVMGPGSRSQRDNPKPRLTHGKNETYDKEGGEKAMVFITKVLERLGFII